MDEIVKRNLLIDFYGKLLTKKQKDMYKMRYEEDLSLSEISEQYHISRQAVSENINNAEKALNEFEEKIGMLKQYSAIEKIANDINTLYCEKKYNEEMIKRIKENIDMLRR